MCTDCKLGNLETLEFESFVKNAEHFFQALQVHFYFVSVWFTKTSKGARSLGPLSFYQGKGPMKVDTLRCLINVSRTFINFRVFSHQYFLIRDLTFIKFKSIIPQTKIIAHFCKNHSGFIV